MTGDNTIVTVHFWVLYPPQSLSFEAQLRSAQATTLPRVEQFHVSSCHIIYWTLHGFSNS